MNNRYRTWTMDEGQRLPNQRTHSELNPRTDRKIHKQKCNLKVRNMKICIKNAKIWAKNWIFFRRWHR